MSQQAERRYLTVMFCDLVGSTKLSTSLDPEDLREVLRVYHAICAKAIESCEGYIAQYLGDGLLVYFGYPRAQEDAAIRAIRAGWRILQEIHTAETFPRTLGSRIEIRIGIHGGSVVIDDVGGGARLERLAVGETPNIAARIQSHARPNQLLISQVIRQKAGQTFAYESLGLIELAGLAEPLELTRVLGPGDDSLDPMRRSNHRRILVGRDNELALLESLWARSIKGTGQTIVLRGEPGIGKSRLIHEFVERIGSNAAQVYDVRCAEGYDKSPLFPVKQFIRTRLGLHLQDSLAQQNAVLETELRLLSAPAEDKFYLAALLSLREFPTALAQLSPREQRQQTLAAVVRLITNHARGPALYLWEDLQAADPSTLELLAAVGAATRQGSIMHVVAIRAGFDLSWPATAGCSQLTIENLNATQSATLITAIAGGRPLPAPLITEIHTRTDGVPLFIEELTKVILERMSDRGASGGDAADLASPLAIPASLQDVLAARLDPLPEGSKVAQCAAVIGRDFNVSILRDIVPVRVCDTGLAQLIAADLVQGVGTSPFSMYRFKHALIRDAAYGSLLKSERRILHKKVADATVRLRPEIARSEPESIARHYSEAAEPSSAIPLWISAGQIAVERSALYEARSHFEAGLELLDTLPKTAAYGAKEVKLREALGPVLIAIKGNTAPEVEMNYARALAVCERFSITEAQFALMFGLRSYHLAQADLAESHALGMRLLKIATESGRREHELEAHVALSNTFFFYGDFASMQKHVDAGLAIFDEALHRDHAQRYGLDPGVICLSRAAQCLWHREESPRATELMHDAIALAERRRHPLTRAYVLANAAVLAQWQRQPIDARGWAEQAVAIAREHGFPFFEAWGMAQLAWALIELGFQVDGDAMMDHAIASAQSIKVLLMQPWLLATRAEANLSMGRLDHGLNTVADALAVVDHTGATYSLPMLYWLRGELQARRGGDQDRANAAESFRHSIRIAQQHDSRAFMRRAQTSLDRLTNWPPLP